MHSTRLVCQQAERKTRYLILPLLMTISLACGAIQPTATPTPTLTNTPVPSPTNTATPTSTPYPPEMEDPEGVAMVFIPSGEFSMGSDAGKPDEAPVHTVYLDSFYIDKYEVTNDLFADFLNKNLAKVKVDPSGYVNYDGQVIYDLTQTGYGKQWTDRIQFNGEIFEVHPDYRTHPLPATAWVTAEAYCAWRGARLPTEAEWEKAARGTDGRKYPWGEAIDGNFANVCDKNCPHGSADAALDDGYAETSPVGIYGEGVSPYGAHDMAGNVYEWVSDWYSKAYYSESPAKNPGGPATGEYKVYRGGSWQGSQRYSSVDTLRTTYRGSNAPIATMPSYGFRCALGINP